MQASEQLFESESWYTPGKGPRYQQLHRYISSAIQSGKLVSDEQLPPERELAEAADVSRVTVRKAISQLVLDGLIEQRQGSGSFVKRTAPRLEQSLSSLISFSELMAARGKSASSQVLYSGLCVPNPVEVMALGLSTDEQVARVHRIRSADDCPMTLEYSSIPVDILPRPSDVKHSLYDVLRKTGQAPTRAVQRVAAVNLSASDAVLLQLPESTAVLKIERTGYLASGRPIEFTSGLYRSDHYDFVSEIRRLS